MHHNKKVYIAPENQSKHASYLVGKGLMPGAKHTVAFRESDKGEQNMYLIHRPYQKNIEYHNIWLTKIPAKGPTFQQKLAGTWYYFQVKCPA